MNFFAVPSLEQICIINVAAQVCNHSSIKKDILLSTWPDCSDNSKFGIDRMPIYLRKWKCKIENSNDIIEKTPLPKTLKHKVKNIINPMRKQMLKWIKYHNINLCISMDLITRFLKKYIILWTSQGIIDKKGTAEVIVNNERMPVKVRFSLACVYCLEDQILRLWQQMSRAERKQVKLQCHDLISLWTYIMEENIFIYNEKQFLQVCFESAFKSSNEVAIKYFQIHLNLEDRERLFVTYAREAISNVAYTGLSFPMSWNDKPRIKEYYIDIVCFLFSQMTEEQYLDLYQSDIYFKHSKLLQYFLDWPYQGYFIETVKRMWNFLPYDYYSKLLIMIASKFANLRNLEDKSYDYHFLLRQFWEESPMAFRRYALSTECAVELISRLQTKTFCSESEKIIGLILKDATDDEKEVIINSDEGRRICIRLICDEKWEFLEIFIKKCLSSDEKIKIFKKEFIISSKNESICLNLIYNKRWDIMEKIINWVYSTVLESKVRKEFLYAVKNSYDLKILIYDDRLDILQRLVIWSLPSSEEIQSFKRNLIDEEGLFICDYLLSVSHWPMAEEFISWCLLSEEDISQFRKYFFSQKFGIYT